MVPEELIIRQYESAKDKFPKLNQPVRVGELWEITGAIDVIDDENNPWATYAVKITVPKKYPEEIFQLQETGGQIPKKADWHNSNSCCVSTIAIIYSVLGEDLSLLNWLVKFAHPYLANHIYKVKTGAYAGGEFLHATDGTIQGYEKLLGLKGVKEVYQKLKIVCSVLQKGRNDKCFCGSGKKFKNCYLLSPFTHKFLGVPYSLLQSDFEEIRNIKKIS
jgi:hypothetical protein